MATGVLLISLLHGSTASIAEKQTLAFTALAFYQIVNAINCRSRNQSIFQLGFRSNISIAIGLLISVSLQVLAVQVSFMNAILGTVPLSFVDWLIIIAGALSLLIADEIRKIVLRKRITKHSP
jgi:Ca2+-transporting ATPase